MEGIGIELIYVSKPWDISSITILKVIAKIDHNQCQSPLTFTLISDCVKGFDLVNKNLVSIKLIYFGIPDLVCYKSSQCNSLCVELFYYH